MPAPGVAYDGFTLLLNIEQRPRSENRVAVSDRRMDSLQQPVVELQWRWRNDDQELLNRLRAVVRAEFDAADLGRVQIVTDSPPDPNAHHHAGTTRMHADSAFGVVDPNGRIHGTDNVYVAGASVFPTAGFANPVLTLVALAVRLAEHLRT